MLGWTMEKQKEEEDAFPVRNLKCCCSLGQDVPVMATDAGSCSQHKRVFSHW